MKIANRLFNSSSFFLAIWILILTTISIALFIAAPKIRNSAEEYINIENTATSPSSSADLDYLLIKFDRNL
jgi:ABC-type multidrug transport system permease subunit